MQIEPINTNIYITLTLIIFLSSQKFVVIVLSGMIHNKVKSQGDNKIYFILFSRDIFDEGKRKY